MIAYHGTSSDPEMIRKEGLRPPNFRAIARQITARYSHRIIPKEVLKDIEQQVKYREIQGSIVHLTLSFEEAVCYSDYPPGGELANSINRTLRHSLGLRPETLRFRRYVIAVRIPTTQEVREDRQIIKEHKSQRGYVDSVPWDIPVPSVPASKIRRIIEVTNR